MPYIKQELRPEIDNAVGALDSVIQGHNDDLGSLNYAITRLVLRRFHRRRRYVGIVEITGTLVCVLLEFYTRHARRYEDEKIEQNGDVVTDEQIADKVREHWLAHKRRHVGSSPRLDLSVDDAVKAVAAELELDWRPVLKAYRARYPLRPRRGA